MKALELERMEMIEGGDCLVEGIAYGLSIVGAFGSIGSGGLLTGVAVGGMIFAADSYWECRGKGSSFD